MRESGHYPPGAEFDPSAPYNQAETPDEVFSVVVSQTLSKTTKVITNDYILEDEGDGHTSTNTLETNWYDAYDANNHYTPIELIELFKKSLETTLKNAEKDVNIKEIAHLKHLIEECNNWIADETEIMEE